MKNPSLPTSPAIPDNLTVLERGWLSSNSILVCGSQSTALIDSGYGTHAAQTLALVEDALGGRPLDVLVNTHLHSDHCGGNAALQHHYPGLKTLIPPGLSHHVQTWNPQALTFTPTGQHCPRFRFDAVLRPATDLMLGDVLWQVHAAPGHDPHSVILFEPASRVLVSADALWEHGFGVVFPELEGVDAFDEVGKTLDLIESLAPRTVIPGHGAVFSGVENALAMARKRLDAFVANPAKHSQYAARALLKFKLLELQYLEEAQFKAWALATPYFKLIHSRYGHDLDFLAWIDQLVLDLIKSGAAVREGRMIKNA